ncbi:hypothetical protein [Methylobacterium mesophilicum]|uniref:hypothetical protein n=1 Tax=Methylobacterium mesophilicum TaxID=39956 RepID=UPI002F33CEC9
MTQTTILVLAASLLCAAAPALAQEEPPQRGNQEFLGVDLDNGGVYYNGRNSGRYCVYRTVEVYNRYTGYFEARRARRCGRGLYLP